MSLDLRDLRLKVTVETDCALDSYSAEHDLDKVEAAREILHRWALKRIEGAKVLHSRLKRDGLLGAPQGASARFGAEPME